MKLKEEQILINILTRTSKRPLGFENCHKSIINQTYKNIKHIVSYEDDKDLQYLNKYDIQKVKVDKYKGEKQINVDGYLFAPYNSYCNSLLNNVKEGWILFLDDDDNLLHNKVIEELVTEIKKNDECTMFIWKMRYPDGNTIPSNKYFKYKKIEINNIGTPCILFNSKYKSITTWDNFKGSDFRFIKKLFEEIPNKIWLKRTYIQINNFGDYGNRNDINSNLGLIYKKSILWFFIPKYHFKLFNVNVLHLKSYKVIILKINNRIKKYFANA